MGFPRHLSQHVGGFVLTQGPLVRLVPVENASMAGPLHHPVGQGRPGRALGLMKVDVLALGMLSALRRCLDLRNALRGQPLGAADIPVEDPATYDMIRARRHRGRVPDRKPGPDEHAAALQPRTFYDLVVEVAIVRPGPSRAAWCIRTCRRASGGPGAGGQNAGYAGKARAERRWSARWACRSFRSR
jgi:error-prone DNA polymerase